MIANDEPQEAINKFKSTKSRILFSAEEFCWPEPSLKDQYPEVSPKEKRFLNSGGIIGYAKDFYEIVTMKPINDEEDDQLYYTKLFLNSTIRV